MIDAVDKAGSYLRMAISVTDSEKQAAVTVLLDEIMRLRAVADEIERKYAAIMKSPPDWTNFTGDDDPRLKFAREAWYGAASIARKVRIGEGGDVTPEQESIRCVFVFEGGTEQPCWGEMLFYSETTEGDTIQACEGHADWSLSASTDDNRRRYRAKP